MIRENTDVRILYEDAHITVLNKPPLWLSQPGKGEAEDLPDAASYLIKRKRERYPCEDDTRDGYIGVVHRLDRGVGGVMVYANSRKSAALLCDAVAKREMTKQYLCVTNGIPEEMSGEYRDLLYKDAKQNKVYVVDRARAGVKEAVLSYEVLDTRVISDMTFALLRVTLTTGRSHQIRAQLSHHGTPIVGDAKYGGRRILPELDGLCTQPPMPGEIALYSHRIAFSHPGNKATANKEKKKKEAKRKRVYADIDVRVYPDKSVLPWAYFEAALSSMQEE